MYDKKLIIGLGTGRCGTTSLSRWLNTWHEFKPIFLEEPDDKELKRWTKHNQSRSHQYKKNPGDVSMGHIHCLEHWLENAEFVVLIMRDREETLKSFRGHRTGGIYWNKLFPQFDFSDDDEVRRYWDWYYETCLKYERDLIVIEPAQLPIMLNTSKI